MDAKHFKLPVLECMDMAQRRGLALIFVSAFFVIERTELPFWHLFLMDFQSFNPMSDENWTKLRNLL
jgi:hypothetical protein